MTLCDDIKSLEFFVFKKHRFALLLYVCIMYVGMYLGGSIIDLYKLSSDQDSILGVEVTIDY